MPSAALPLSLLYSPPPTEEIQFDCSWCKTRLALPRNDFFNERAVLCPRCNNPVDLEIQRRLYRSGALTRAQPPPAPPADASRRQVTFSPPPAKATPLHPPSREGSDDPKKFLEPVNIDAILGAGSARPPGAPPSTQAQPREKTNLPPTAAFSFETNSLTALVDGTKSTDPDGRIVRYHWDWGDGSAPSISSRVSHTYTAEGTYNITLTVTDDGGMTASVTKPVAVAPVSRRAVTPAAHEGSPAHAAPSAGPSNVGSTLPLALGVIRCSNCGFDNSRLGSEWAHGAVQKCSWCGKPLEQ